MGQSEEFFRALKMQGKDALLVRMPDEFHGWRRPSHRLLNQLYLQAWFERYRKRHVAVETIDSSLFRPQIVNSWVA